MAKGFTVRPSDKLSKILDDKAEKQHRSKNSIVIEVLEREFLPTKK